MNDDGATDLFDIELLLRSNNNYLTILDEDGDFKSEECIEFLEESDVVVTNPPFSLFKEYIDVLIEHDKKFIVLGNNNAITYKGIFNLFMQNRIWLGYHSNQTLEFRLSDSYEKWNRIEDGVKYGKVPAISWFTNVDIPKRHEELILYKNYNEFEYPRYVTFDAIDVGKVSEIPKDYYGMMGVPKTFMQDYKPDQFEISGDEREDENIQIGIERMGEQFIADYRGQGGRGHYTSNMHMLCYYDKEGKAKIPFSRIIIRRKHEN